MASEDLNLTLELEQGDLIEKEILRSFFALPLLKPEEMDEGLNSILVEVNTENLSDEFKSKVSKKKLVIKLYSCF